MTSSFLYIVYVPIKGTLDTLQNERRGLNAHSADVRLIHVAVHCNWFLTECVGRYITSPTQRNICKLPKSY